MRALLVAVLILLASLLAAVPAAAVFNGEPDDAPWAAYIDINGGVHSLALRADGTVVAWGADPYGETHVPSAAYDVIALSVNPTGRFSLALRADGIVVAWGSTFAGETSVPTGLAGVRGIAAGARHALALRADGAIVEWGVHTYWQYGVEHTVPATPPADLHDVTFISTGAYHNVAALTDGTTRVWGANTCGQTNPPPTPTSLTTADAGGSFTVALAR